jgi:outer membrane protein assembly factor BamB
VVPTERSVLVPEGYGVTGGSQHRLAALDPDHGRTRWTTVADGGGFGRPAVHDGRVYVGTGLDTVRALDAGTGRITWEYDAGGVEEYGGGAWGRPLVVDGYVYVGVSHSDDPNADPTDSTAYTHRMVALDAADGTELWTTEVTTGTWAGPVSTAGVVVAGTEDGILRGFGPETGDVLWEFSLPGGLRQRPVVVGDFLTLVAADGTAVSVDVPAGTVRRTAKVVDGTTAVVRDGDTLYLGGESGGVVAVATTPSPDLSRWLVRWEYEADVPVGAIAHDDQSTFVVDQSGHLHLLDGEGTRTRRRRLVEQRYDDRCGWIPDHEFATGAVLDRQSLFVASRWSLRSFDRHDL